MQPSSSARRRNGMFRLGPVQGVAPMMTRVAGLRPEVPAQERSDDASQCAAALSQLTALLGFDHLPSRNHAGDYESPAAVVWRRVFRHPHCATLINSCEAARPPQRQVFPTLLILLAHLH